MPPSEMTATSVVPPPMSTMSEPDGSETGSPAPIAAAMGSSIRRAQRAPALRAASRTARFSTSVTPDGMPSSIRGRGIRPTRSCTLFTKYLIICSVTSKSLMTPSRSGRTAMIEAGVRPTMRLASAPIARTRLVLASIATTDGSRDHDPAIAHVHERVGRAEVDPDVAGEEAEESVEHEGRGRFLAALRWAASRPDGRAAVWPRGERGSWARARGRRASEGSIPARDHGTRRRLAGGGHQYQWGTARVRWMSCSTGMAGVRMVSVWCGSQTGPGPDHGRDDSSTGPRQGTARVRDRCRVIRPDRALAQTPLGTCSREGERRTGR